MERGVAPHPELRVQASGSATPRPAPSSARGGAIGSSEARAQVACAARVDALGPILLRCRLERADRVTLERLGLATPTVAGPARVQAPTLQRVWSDTPIDYSVMSAEKGTFRTGKLKHKSLQDLVKTFVEDVQKGRQKAATSALVKIKARLTKDSKATVKLPKKATSSKAALQSAQADAKAFYTKWINATQEHLDHIAQGGFADLARAYTTTTTTTTATTVGSSSKEEEEDERPATQAPVVRRFTDEQLEEHMVAYRKARYYHATKPTAFESILGGGLDPARRGKGGADEAQEFNTGTSPGVFLGGDITTTRYYKRQLGQKINIPHFRAFLLPDEVETVIEDMGDEDNLAYFRPNLGVASEQLILGPFHKQSPERLRQIFSIVRRHYPPETDIEVEEVMARHFEAIACGWTTHHHGQKAEKYARFGGRRYQYPDEGYESD